MRRLQAWVHDEEGSVRLENAGSHERDCALIESRRNPFPEPADLKVDTP